MKKVVQFKPKKKKKSSFLSVVGKESHKYHHNVDKMSPKALAGAGESGTKDFGSCKSFKVQMVENEGYFLKFLEDMNDIRYAVAENINRKLKELEDQQKPLKSMFSGIKKDGTSKDGDYAKTIRLEVQSYLENLEKPERYQEYAQIPYWVSYDLEGKYKSYVALHGMAGGDKKDLLMELKKVNKEDKWLDFSKDALNQDLDLSVVESVTGEKNKKKFKAQDFYLWAAQKANEKLKGKLQKFRVVLDKKLKIEKMISVEGVKEHNIFIRSMNIYIGQYNGQSTNRAIKLFSEKHNFEAKSRTDIYSWIKQQPSSDQDKLREQYRQNEKKLTLLSPIKKFPSPPTFHPTSFYKESGKSLTLDRHLETYTLLKEKIESYGDYSEEGFQKNEKLDIDSLPEELKKYSEKQDRSIRKALGLKPEDGKTQKTHLGSLSNSSQKRFLRRAVYHKSLEKAFCEEIDFLDERIKLLTASLSKSTVSGSAKKLKTLSHFMNRRLRLLLSSREVGDFDRGHLSEEIAHFVGLVQMEGMKIKPYRRFSFQFRQLDQEGVYPVFKLDPQTQKEKLFFQFRVHKGAGNKVKIPFLRFDGDSICQKDSKSLPKSSLIDIEARFPKRLGRKFIFNSLMGLRFEQSLSKMGAPNFIVTYKKGAAPQVEASIAWMKSRFVNNILTYPKDIKKEAPRAQYLLDNTRYLIGLDRGENKLLSYTVWDIEKQDCLQSGVLGSSDQEQGFKSKVDELKQKQQEAQRVHNVKEYKKITRRISNIIDSYVDRAIVDLTKLALKYQSSKKSEHTALVFEYLDPNFSRQGNKAYVELRQMNQLIVRIKENRTYYGLPFQIYEIGAAHTSQACSCCGLIDKASRGKDAQGNVNTERFTCVGCHCEADADEQASLNIALKWIAKKSYVASGSKDKKTDKELLSDYIKQLRIKCAS